MNDNIGEIVIYHGEDGSALIEVQLVNETVWLSQRQMAELFDTSSDNISLHLKNIFSEKELDKRATTEDFSVVQKEGRRRVQRTITHYNLDAIISVGYRVNSKRGVRFRQWATSVLREHLIHGYTINEKRLAEKGLLEMEQAVALLSSTLKNHQVVDDEGQAVLDVVSNYAKSWTLLLQYDEQQLSMPRKGYKVEQALEHLQANKAIAVLKTVLVKKGEASDLFGQERGEQLQGILGSVNQTFDGQELYSSIAEKAAHLLYFVIKDHPFSDGNKRIGSFLFVLFLQKNGVLQESGINENGLVALALLIAESDPKQKDLMIRLILNFLDR